MGLHFLPRCNPWLKGRCTWSIQWDGQEVRSQTDYILVTDHRLFQDVDVRDTQHHSDHYMILGYLRGDPAKDIMGYLRKARRLPLRPLRHDIASDPYKLFSELNTQIPKFPLHKWLRWSWIYDKTWASIDARAIARREGAQRTVRKLSQRIRAGLRTDQKRRAEESGSTIEA